MTYIRCAGRETWWPLTGLSASATRASRKGDVNTGFCKPSQASPSFWYGIVLHGQYRRSDRQLAASLESPLIYNELHELIALAIRSIIHWNCSDRNLRLGSDQDARAQGDLRE